MKIIDVHNHLGLSEDGGHGQSHDLLQNMKDHHVFRSVIFATDEADKGETFENPNARILDYAKTHPQLIPFVRIIPSKGDIAIKEFKKGVKNNARGLKLKTSDGFVPQDSRLILDLIPQKNHFPVIIHTAHDEHSQPRLWEKIIADYAHINFILAHSGKDHFLRAAKMAKQFKNAFAETSTLSLHRTKQVYEIAGAQNIVFGSDYPYSHQELEIRKYELIVNNAAELNLIMYENAARILGIMQKNQSVSETSPRL